MASMAAQSGKDWGALTSSIIFVAGTAIVLTYIYVGSPDRLPPESCVGAHTSALLVKADDTHLISIPATGFDFYQIEVSEACASFEPGRTALADLKKPALCAGDDLMELGAADPNCHVVELRRIREAQAKSRM